MTLLILILLTICSFLFYGVVGQDKTWLLTPAFMLGYGVLTIALLKRSCQLSVNRRKLVNSSPTVNDPLPTTTFLWLLFLLYGIGLLSNAAVPFESKWVLFFLGSVVGAYLVWGSELTAFKDNRILLGLLIFVVMLTALYGLVLHYKSPHSILWTERYTDHYEGRLASTYICPNHFAHLMQMLLPFCVALLFIPQSGLYLKILAVYSFLVFLPPMFLTESRAGWLGSIAAVGICVCLMALRRSKKLFAALVILVPLCAVLLLLGAWRYSETFQRRMLPVVEFLDGQAKDGIGSDAPDFRPQTWMDTIDMIKAAPLIGHGPGNYRYTYPEYRKRYKGQGIVTGHPHNEYLELITDYGLIGFGLFSIAWIYGCVWVLVKSLKTEETRHAYMGFAFLGAVAGTMVHSFFDFQMHVYPNALIFALLAALAVGPLTRARSRQQGARGDAALEYSDKPLLSVQRDSFSRERTQASQNKNRDRHTKKDDPEVVVSSRKPQAANRIFSWLLAVGYLLLTVWCFQVMGSAFIRALADKAAEQAVGVRYETAKPDSVTRSPTAERLYTLAATVDPQNWRAYKGMGELLYKERYYCLEPDRKIELARQERHWFEKAYEQNPKDPEIISALGKSLIFIGNHQGSGPGTSGAGEKSSVALSLQSSSELIEHGIELLREACRYRKFNETYWWLLGSELRKAGYYDEALVVFQSARGIKNSPSIQMNIKWLEKQVSGTPAVGTPDTSLQTTDLLLKREEFELSDLLEQMEKSQ